MRKQIITLILIFILIVTGTVFSQPADLWFRTYDGGNGMNDYIFDIYQCGNGNLATCGNSEADTGFYRFWVLKLSPRGDVMWTVRTGFDQVRHQYLYSIVDVDNGGFVTVGFAFINNYQLAALRLDDDGETIWMRDYGGDGAERGYAVIELKSGEYLCAGSVTSFGAGGLDGYLLKLDGENGDVIWERAYGSGETDEFVALREIDGGAIVVGRTNRNGRQGDVWIVRVDDEGDVIWEHVYNTPDFGETAISMASCPDEQGYVVCGQLGGYGDWFLLRINREGQQQYLRYYDISQNDPYEICNAVTALADGGFAMVGRNYAPDGSYSTSATVLRVDGGGDPVWLRQDRYDNMQPQRGYSSFGSAIFTRDGSITVAGTTQLRETRVDGLIAVIIPERSAPQIIEHFPVNLDTTILRDNSIQFWVHAIDLQEDSIFYCWTLEDEIISDNDTIEIEFNDLGDWIVTCTASDGDLADTIRWTVNVRNMFIADVSPDSLGLTVRRGTRVDFAIDSVAYVDDGQAERLSYAWRLFDTEAERWDSVGTDSAVSIFFDRTGRYGVEAMAYLDESSDGVRWDVNVRGVIRSFSPSDESLTVTSGSSITFELDPFNPQSDSLLYRRTFDGEELAGDAAQITLDFNIEGRYEVVGYAFEGAEADSQRWVVTVARPEGADEFRVRSYELRMSVMPNPFNSLTEISFSLPKVSDVSVRLYDINGREIETLLEEKVKPTGSYIVTLDGKDLPAGLYFARLVAGGDVKTAKVVLMR